MISSARRYAAVLSAHHGSAISYDITRQVTLSGVVTEWVWRNPHGFVMFDVTDEQGKAVHWAAGESDQR